MAIRRLRRSLMECASKLSLLSPLLAACGAGDSGLELGEERSSPDEAADTTEMIEAIKVLNTPGESLWVSPVSRIFS
jgi:hypothetical protein